MTFRNKNWTKRNYECTNVVACVADKAPEPYYVPCDSSFIANMQPLWLDTVGGQDVRYYGWL